MPISTIRQRLNEQDIQRFTLSDMLLYLPQLQRLDLSYLDRTYVQQAITNGEFFRERDRLEVLREVLLHHYQHLIRFPYTTCPPLELRLNHSGADNTLRTVRPVEEEPQVEAVSSWARNVRQHSWETAFTLEEEQTDFPETLEESNELIGEERGEPRLSPKQVKTLKEIAELIPPGVVGMQYDGDRSPYNLVFRPKAEDDPAIHLLKGFGWFTVRGNDKVLWAAATLEAYNFLIESDIEFTQTLKVEQWWQYINSDEPLPYLAYFDQDCPLFDYQKEAVQFLFRRKRAMLALSPGLGKTLTAAYAASLHSSIRRVLLVCPASLLYYWYSELKKWESVLRQKPLVEIWHKETGTLPQTLPENTQFWAITNPETVSRYTEEFILDDQGAQNFWDLLIVDESIMYKHRDSKRSAALNRLAGAVPDMWELTGAPATRFLDDMWHQFHMLSNRGYASYWRFAESYCRIDDNEFARSVIANRRGAESLIKTNFRDVYFARSQDQVADIPDWLFVDMDIAMKPKQEAVYRKLQKELRVVIAGRDDWEEVQVDDRLALTLRSLQVASNPVLLGADNSSGKWAALPDLMEIYPGPYLVWVNFIRTGEMLKESLRSKFGSDRVELANGSTPVIERQRLVDHFQAEGLDVLILNSQVGKFGFTLTRARTSFFVERGYDDSYFQCLHRNRRIGTVFAPIVVNMRSVTIAGGRTIDHVVHDALDYRTGMIKRLTMGDLRKVIEEDE